VSDVSLKGGVTVHGAGGGIRTPDLLITNQLLYRPELRQPDKEQIIALPVPAEQLDGLSRQIWRGSRDRSGLPQPNPNGLNHLTPAAGGWIPLRATRSFSG
jgi:hypothetical protein